MLKMIAALAAALFLVACGGGEDDPKILASASAVAGEFKGGVEATVVQADWSNASPAPVEVRVRAQAAGVLLKDAAWPVDTMQLVVNVNGVATVLYDSSWGFPPPTGHDVAFEQTVTVPKGAGVRVALLAYAARGTVAWRGMSVEVVQ